MKLYWSCIVTALRFSSCLIWLVMLWYRLLLGTYQFFFQRIISIFLSVHTCWTLNPSQLLHLKMMYSIDEHGGPKAKKSSKVEPFRSSMSPSSKAELKLQKKLTTAVSKNVIKRKVVIKSKSDKLSGKVDATRNEEKVLIAIICISHSDWI